MDIEEKVYSFWRLGYKMPKMKEQLGLSEDIILAVFTKVVNDYFSRGLVC